MTAEPTRPVAPVPELLTKRLIRTHYLPAAERTLDRWIAAGVFPRPDLALSGKALFWRRETVERWIADRAAEGGGR